MKRRELLAIVFSDLHLNLWTKFNQNMKRTRESFRVLSFLANKYPKVPALFCGDLFHKSESIDTDLLEMWQEFEPGNPNSEPYRWEMWYIDGNHSLKHRNTVDKPQKSLATLLRKRWMKDLNFKSEKLGDLTLIKVHGIPYIDDNAGINEYLTQLINNHHIGKGSKYKHILMLHTTYPGAKDTDGREVEATNAINPNLLNKFDLILCGHIHKPQKLSKKVYMVGCPIQQRRTDMHCKLGYWELYSEPSGNLTMAFKELKGFPKFIDVESEEEIKDDGNYYTVIPPKPRKEEVTTHKITKRLSKKALARKYMKAKGIKDKNKQKLLTDILIKTESC